MRDGFPIALGYFAVSFSLGIAARKAGLTPLQGFFASLFLFTFHAVAFRTFFADILFSLDDGLGTFFIGQLQGLDYKYRFILYFFHADLSL